MAESPELERKIALRTDAARKHLYDPEKRLFVSGKDRQVSWASQVWAVLSGIAGKEEGLQCLTAAGTCPETVGMVTPYMMHHYAEALCLLGEKKTARQVILDDWGGMISCGADTFWELFNPKNPDESPYGSPVVNSYCHAWSCTPSWFLRSGILE